MLAMSMEQIGITWSIFELEQSYLHQNWSEFGENFTEMVKRGLYPKWHYP